jgi:two-component system cell cycle response regulator DivK
MKLLYAEDNDNNVFLLTVRLGDLAGHQILIARDGAAVCDMAAAERPDLILMDLELPVVSGWEAARRLKARPDTATIPVIALSAHALTDARAAALAAGCDAFVTKPIDFNALITVIDRLTTGRRAAAANPA